MTLQSLPLHRLHWFELCWLLFCLLFVVWIAWPELYKNSKLLNVFKITIISKLKYVYIYKTSSICLFKIILNKCITFFWSWHKKIYIFVFIWYHLCWSSFETSFLSSVHSQLYALLPTTINSIFKLCSAFIAIYLTTTTTSLDHTLNCCLCSKANDTLLLLDTIQPFWLIHEPKFVNKQKRSELQTFYQIALQW